MLDFDNFINKPCVEIFGRVVTYIPANKDFNSFTIKGDFHQDYSGVNTKSLEVEISSNEIVLFMRDVAMPQNYSKAIKAILSKLKISAIKSSTFSDTFQEAKS